MTGVAGLADDPAYPPHEPNMPPVPLGKTGTRYAQAMNRLGWHWWPSEVAVATTEYDGRGKCINLADRVKTDERRLWWPNAGFTCRLDRRKEHTSPSNGRDHCVDAEGVENVADIVDERGQAELAPEQLGVTQFAHTAHWPP